MAMSSKRMRENSGKAAAAPCTVPEAVACFGKMQGVKFGESVDVAIKLGVDMRQSEQQVQGAAVLPHGTGRTVRIAVFAQGEAAATAREAGADLVGMEDLAEQVKGGMLDFDIAIATPDAMATVGQLGRVLGPRGLMPNPKTGTVTADVAAAISNAKKGQVRFRADKGGIVHGSIGRADFTAEALQENLEALVGALKKAKPAVAKGVYLVKITLATTMGPGLAISIDSLNT